MAQSKSHIDLSMVSDKFTEQVLTDILCKAYSGKKVRLVHWDFGEGFAKGDSYLSTVNKGELFGIIDDDPRKVQINFVVKSIPKNVGRRNTFRSTDFFHNEIVFYTQVRMQQNYPPFIFQVMHI